MTEIVLPTSSWRPGDVAMLALLEGRLVEASPGVLTAAPAHGDGDGVALVWPAGFTAVRPPEGPVQVLDPEGRVVLKVGDRFGVGGGSGAEGAFIMNAYPALITG